MGRPETKLWVSLGATSTIFLLVMFQDHALASSIFPLKPNSPFGALQESLSSWELENVKTEGYNDGEYTNVFSMENSSPAGEQNDDRTGKGYDNIDLEDGSFQNSFQRGFMSSFTNIGENDMHELSHKMDGTEKDHSFDRILSHPNHNTNGKENDDLKGNGAEKSFQRKTMRFTPSKNMNAKSDSEYKATKTTIRLSVGKDATTLANKAVTNQSKQGEAYIPGGQEESNTSSQLKFPYRIPFPYVRRKSETEHKNIPAKVQNINGGGVRGRAPNPSHRFVNGDVFLQRRNRSRRSTQQQPQLENVGQTKDHSEKVEKENENVGEAVQVDSEENQQHKSSERATGSVEGYSIGEDEMAETNVRDNATSRPPTNPMEVLERLTHLLHKMLRELSMFGQKFTLRLIRMTERQDIDQMQEIMKDFEISAVKPIFFIAGGLRKLNGSVVAATAAQVVVPNLTRNASVILNDTVENEENLEVLPVVVNSTSTEAESLPLPHPEIDGTTRFPILRPSGISSLPVEYDTDNNNEETTTVNPEEESETEVLVPDPSTTNSPNETSAVNVTSPPPPPLITTRRKRSIPGFDEFQFFPVFGRSARTENPYDDEVEEYDSFEFEPASEERRLDDENSPHLTSLTTSTNRASDDVIDQSHSKPNDEISLVSDITISTIPKAELGSALEKVAVLSSPQVSLTGVDSSSVIPLNDSITKAQTERGNDHKPGTHAASTANEKNNISHEEKYLPRVNPLRTVSIVDSIVNSHYSLPLAIPMQTPILQNKSTLSIDSTDTKLKANESLNLAHETTKQSPAVVNLDSGNDLEISKSDLPQNVFPTLLHNNTSQLLLERSSGDDDDDGIVALPKETLQGEERAFHENVAQKSLLHDNTFVKERKIDSPGIQQLLNPDLNNAGTLNNGVVSENERIIKDPPLLLPVEATSNSSPTAESLLVRDTDTVLIVPEQVERVDSIRVPPPTTEGIEATSSLLENRSGDVIAVASHSAAITTEPRKGNQNDPQDEIKAKSPQIQVDVVNSLPIVTGEIKGTLFTHTGEKVPLTPIQVEHVSLSTSQKDILSSKPVATINNAVIEETVPDPNPISIADSLEVVPNIVVPLPLQTKESNILLDSVRPAINPAEIILNEESIEIEDQTPHNKKQSLTLVENQEDLVKDVMKKVGEGGGEKDEIGRDKMELIPNQVTFHAPTTVLEESKIIGNNNATFLLSDKTSIPTTNASPIRNDGSGIASDNIDTAAVRNKEVVSVQNSKSSHDDDGGIIEESLDGSIVVPVTIVDENVDVLSSHVVALPQENQLSREFENVESNILLSPIEVVAVPSGNAVGAISGDTVNMDGSSGNESVELPRLTSDRSEDVVVQPENKILSLGENEDLVLHPDENVRQEEIRNVPDISAAATDLTNPVRDVTNVAESVPANIVKTPVKIDLVPSVAELGNDVSIPQNKETLSKEIRVGEETRAPSNEKFILDTPSIQTELTGKISPVVAPIVEPVKIVEVSTVESSRVAPVEAPIANSIKIAPVKTPVLESESVTPVKVPIVEPLHIAPVEAPILNAVKIAPVEIPVVDSVKVAPVEVAESIKITPMEIPIVESVKVAPVEVPVVESVKVAPVEAPVVESVKVTPVEVPVEESVKVAPVEVSVVESVKVAPVEVPVVESVKVAPVEVPFVESVKLASVEAPIVESVKVASVGAPNINPQITPMQSTVLSSRPAEASNIDILHSGVTHDAESHTPLLNGQMVTKQFANPVDAVNSDTLKPTIVQTRNPEPVKVNDILSSKPENNDIKVEATTKLSSLSKDVSVLESVDKNTSMDIPIVPLVGTHVSAVPDVTTVNGANVKLAEKVATGNNVPIQSIPLEISQTKVPVDEISVSTDPIIQTKVSPVSTAAPALVSEVSSVVPISYNTEKVKPETVLSRPGANLITSPVVVPENEALTEPVVKVVQEAIPQQTIEPVNKVARPILQSTSQPVSAIAGTGDEIGILPDSDPDSHFGIKPIDTEPHFQIPGLKPSIPERPHPEEYFATISQGIDTDTATLLFSPPTNPILVPSPPVYSGYSPTAIFQKQQQMMQNYFSGLLYRRALPV